jgi:N-acylglucosamine-6-phosphate 2-epimerase
MSIFYPVLGDSTVMLDFESLRGHIIVSCQAGPDEPLHGAIYMAAMARAAAIGGAAGIRANGADDVAAICADVSLPVIGINKRSYPGSEVYITPTFEDAHCVVLAGAKIIALDATPRPRPSGVTLAQLVEKIHQELQVPVMADLSCLDDALAAEAAGVDFLGTTLSGYTAHGRSALPGPDLDFITELVHSTHKPVIAEGRFAEPHQVAEAFARGAYAVVVGGAITRPQDITRRFADAAPAQTARHPSQS